MCSCAPHLLDSISPPRKINSYAIYGEDNRLDIHYGKRRHRRLGYGVGLFIHRDKLVPEGKRFYAPQGIPFKDLAPLQSRRLKNFPLCEEVRFQDQLSYGDCTGVLIAPNRFLTAGHCVRHYQETKQLEKMRVVFFVEEFRKDKYQRDHILVRKNYVRKIARVVEMVHERGRKDYAIVEFAKPVKIKMFYALPEDKNSFIHELGDDLILIGHPLGLAKKFSLDSKIKGRDSSFYYADLDGFMGNSGSPIINLSKKDKKGRPYLLGIYAAGKDDFQVDEERSCVKESSYETIHPRLMERIFRLDKIGDLQKR